MEPGAYDATEDVDVLSLPCADLGVDGRAISEELVKEPGGLAERPFTSLGSGRVRRQSSP